MLIKRERVTEASANPPDTPYATGRSAGLAPTLAGRQGHVGPGVGPGGPEAFE